MNQDQQDFPPEDPDADGPPGRIRGTPTPTSTLKRRGPDFTEIDEDEDYEEPDRDTDLASFYGEDDVEDELFERASDMPDDPDTTSIWSFEEPEEKADPGEERGYAPPGETLAAEAYEWDEESYPEEGAGLRQWPVGMIIVGLVALALLAAGGYGVIQQRSAMEEEILQLQAALAVSSSPEEVTASRTAAAEAERRNTELQASLDALALENERLTAAVAGLEGQLQAQQEALAEKAEAPPPAPPPAREVPPPTAPKAESTGATAAGAWFVNFGSYARRDTAALWAGKLDPEAGEVVVTTGASNGKTLYRVRVVKLASREQAESIARKLEADYDLPRLWVGKQ